MTRPWIACWVVFLLPTVARAADLQVGVAKVDATPTTPIRLSGYAARKSESEGIEQRLHVRAIAIGTGKQDVSVLMTLDSMAIPRELTEEVAARLKEKLGLPRERLVVCGTHSHGAPCLTNAAPNIFGHPVTAEEQAHIDRYTREVADRLEQAAVAAVADLKPATLAVARGSVGFAANRRKPIAPGVPGPVDQELPVMVARGADGAVRAIVANYACHCTTGGPDVNKVHGDWAACACDDLEAAYKGAVALVTIGCGADANPSPRGTLALARQHGAAVASEVARLLKSPEQFKPIDVAPVGRFKVFEAAYDRLPTKEQLETLAKEQTAAGANARIQLERWARDGKLAETIPYTVQSWTFGDELTMVFLAGEVVVDYDLRLKHDFDPNRLWVTAYANDVLCYIPSRRILAEGGYEAEGAMVYYARPTRFAPAIENDIVRAVHSIVPEGFRTETSLKEFPPPKSPEESRRTIQVDGDLRVELVAAEPLIASPVAIDWDLRGRMWVLEMYDYPSGLHDNNTPGGRVVILESTKGDGRYDKRTVFLDHLPYPQGLMCWRNGVLVCAAPDILYAPDDDHDDKPDAVRRLFSGFSPDNQQWEVNGLTWGLDNWVYGASSIHNEPIQTGETDHTLELGGRDFRLNPDTLAFEPAAGRTQFCRVRDDFDNWFGNDNSNSLWHYPLEDRYVRRNPEVAYPPPKVAVVADPDPSRLHPVSRLLERFNNPESANRVTSACGPTIYRDELLFKGDGGRLNAFFCEPVHNMVRGLVLTPNGPTFTAHRSPADDREFLASTDNWFRPVQTRTGPDGCLYVVDMYRFVIEHPRWITKERLATLDTRAGADRGRIYRVVPGGATPRAIEDLSKLSGAQLARRIDHPNGVVRDLAHRELVHRRDRAAVPVLVELATTAKNAAVRAQAAAALDGLRAMTPAVLTTQLNDADPRVRRLAVRLCEPVFAEKSDEALAKGVVGLANDPDPAVRYQVALTLGEMKNDEVARALGAIAASSPADPWIRAAVLSSAAKCPDAILMKAVEWPAKSAGRAAYIAGAARLLGNSQDDGALAIGVSALARDAADPTNLGAVAALLDALKARKRELRDLPQKSRDELLVIVRRARQTAADATAPVAARVAGLNVLLRNSPEGDAELAVADRLLQPAQPPALQAAALAALSRDRTERAAGLLAAALPRMSPGLRTKAIDTLASRPAGVAALVTAVEENRLSAADLPPATREKLVAQGDAALRARVAKLFAAQRPAARVEALKQFAASLKLKGDPAKGKATFEKSCVACHQLGGIGSAVGPNLAALTDKSANYLLTAIVDPNAAVEGRFVAYQLETADGDTYVGLLADENASGLTILQPNAIKQSVARAEIKSLTTSKLSLMPEGLEQGLTPQDVANLIAFVQNSK